MTWIDLQIHILNERRRTQKPYTALGAIICASRVEKVTCGGRNQISDCLWRE